jgi:DUF3048 family protein
MTSNRLRRLAVPFTILLLAAACGGGGKKPAPPPAPTTPLPPIAPLTGLPLTDPAKLARPALTIKVENPPAARPQSGLDTADVVFEEVVEGGITRFLAVFHSTDAALVGPVRSVRPSDPEVIAPFGGLFGYSGGTPKFINLLRSTPGITDVGVDKLDEGDGKAYFRRPGRNAPDNLYTSTAKLWAAGPAHPTPPRPLGAFLPAGQPFAAAGTTPATRLTAQVGDISAVYDYDAAGGVYKRSGLVEGSGSVTPANVVVQFTSYQISPGDEDANGTPVEKAVTVGSGDAIVVSGGLAVKGKWSKPSASAYTTYTDSTGAPIKLRPGRTWVELARNGAAVTTR